MTKRVVIVPQKFKSNEVSRRVKVFYCPNGGEERFNADSVIVTLRKKQNQTTVEFKLPEMKAWQFSKFIRGLEKEVTNYES